MTAGADGRDPADIRDDLSDSIHAMCATLVETCLIGEPGAGMPVVEHRTGRGGRIARRYELLKAAILSESGRHEEALELAGGGTGLDDAYARGWHARGRVLWACGDEEGALECYRMAEARAAGDELPIILASRAAALYHMGRHAECAAEAGRALELNPRDGGLLAMRSEALLEAGRKAGALEAARTAAEASPGDGAAVAAAVAIPMDAGMHAEALEAIDGLDRTWLGVGRAWLIKARALAALGRPEEALDALTVAVSLDPSHVRDARESGDLDPVRDDERFRRLVG